MSEVTPMQRVIFRPAAVQRYIQGSEVEAPAAATQPAVAVWYCCIAVCVLTVIALLYIPLQQHSIISLLFSNPAAPASTSMPGEEGR